MFVDKHFINTGAYISKSKRCYNEKPSAHYFCMRMKIPLNFNICISVPLSANHSSNNKGGVCTFYRKTLPLTVVRINYLHQCINFVINTANKICRITHLNRSPSQIQYGFQTLLSNLELNLDNLTSDNPFFSVMIGDFNAKSNNWYVNDKTFFEDRHIEQIASQFGLCQLIKWLTHVLENSSSCTDLIFTSSSCTDLIFT